MDVIKIIDKIKKEQIASKEELVYLLENITDEEVKVLRRKAQVTSMMNFRKDIYIRGLIEISSFCKNDCLYCGLRRSNKNAVRYRLTKEQILSCCKLGYELGFRTFVMQGGEDPYFTDDLMCEIIGAIKSKYPDCAITLSLGERGKESFKRLYEAGADRYLLRHETADPEHYKMLHPEEMSLESRKQALYDLKEIGFQTGAGFMVGSPFQTIENLADDLLFIKELKPQMCGIGPFIPHHDTAFADKPQGSLRMTLILLSLIRLMNPKILLPATTALGTISPDGREQGILHGANVVMPNLSPEEHRADYAIYDNKLATGVEAAEGLLGLKKRFYSIGYQIVTDRGDYKE